MPVKGQLRSEFSKRKQSETIKKKQMNGTYLHPMKDKHHSEQWNKNISSGSLAKHWHRPDEANRKQSNTIKRKYKSGYVSPLKGTAGHLQTKITRKKMSLSRTILWSDKKFRNRAVKAIVKGVHPVASKFECDLDSVLQKNFPNEWKYVGSGDFILGGKNPDFKHKTKKLLIELYEDCWHYGQTGIDRIDYFRQFGFNTLIVWEHELRDEAILLNKLRHFVATDL